MYFKPYPKESKDELFDREEELNLIIKSVSKGERFILLLGIRRVGKTSILNVALKELEFPYIKIDVSKLEAESASMQLLYREISRGLERNISRFERFKEFLKNIKGLKIGPLGVEIDIKK